MINKFLITIFALTIFIPTFQNISYANKNNLSNQLVEIDENINEVEEFDFNQDFEIEEGERSPGWLRYQKRIK